MQISMSLKKMGINIMLEGLPPAEVKKALYDSGQVVVNSTHVGYMKEVSPEGDEWEPNVGWYRKAKGGAAILTGPTSKKVQGGKYSGYEFANINPKRMRNSLLVKVEGTDKAYVKYDQSASERAQITQTGGKSSLKLISPTGKTVSIDMTIPARPHLGIAEHFARLGSMTDPEHILHIFTKIVDKL